MGITNLLVVAALVVGSPHELNTPAIRYSTGIFCVTEAELRLVAEMATQHAPVLEVLAEINKTAGSAVCNLAATFEFGYQVVGFKENVQFREFVRGVYEVTILGTRTDQKQFTSYQHQLTAFTFGKPQDKQSSAGP